MKVAMGMTRLRMGALNPPGVRPANQRLGGDMEKTACFADAIPLLGKRGRKRAGQPSFDTSKAMAELRGQPLPLKGIRAARRERRERLKYIFALPEQPAVGQLVKAGWSGRGRPRPRGRAAQFFRESQEPLDLSEPLRRPENLVAHRLEPTRLRRRNRSYGFGRFSVARYSPGGSCLT